MPAGDPPPAPGACTFTNIKPTTLTVSWTAPASDGSDPPFAYILSMYVGDSDSGTSVDTGVFGLTKNLTGLTAGQDYTFTVKGVNDSLTNSGRGDSSDPATVQMLAGAKVRESGVWETAVPWVRISGQWKMAVPYIRVAGVWKQTH